MKSSCMKAPPLNGVFRHYFQGGRLITIVMKSSCILAPPLNEIAKHYFHGGRFTIILIKSFLMGFLIGFTSLIEPFTSKDELVLKYFVDNLGCSVNNNGDCPGWHALHLLVLNLSSPDELVLKNSVDDLGCSVNDNGNRPGWHTCSPPSLIHSLCPFRMMRGRTLPW